MKHSNSAPHAASKRSLDSDLTFRSVSSSPFMPALDTSSDRGGGASSLPPCQKRGAEHAKQDQP